MLLDKLNKRSEEFLQPIFSSQDKICISHQRHPAGEFILHGVELFLRDLGGSPSKDVEGQSEA